MHSFLVAVSYLTILPISLRQAPSTQTIAQSRFWYPLVGLLLGAVLGGATAAVGLLAAPAVGAIVVVAAWLVLTGALHLDGCCDLCDGLFGRRTPAERLAVMKDPHLGTFALAGGCMVLLAKFAAIETLLKQSPARAGVVIATAGAVARCLVLWLAAGAVYPRAEGTGKLIVESTRKQDGWIAAVVALLITAVAAIANADTDRLVAQTGLLFLPAFLTITILRSACDRRLGGVTGDCLGAGIEIAEVVFLLTAALV